MKIELIYGAFFGNINYLGVDPSDEKIPVVEYSEKKYKEFLSVNSLKEHQLGGMTLIVTDEEDSNILGRLV